MTLGDVVWGNRVKELRKEALGIVERTPGGIGHLELIDRLLERKPRRRRDEVRQVVARLDQDFDRRIFRLPGGTILSLDEFKADYARDASQSPIHNLPDEATVYPLCLQFVLDQRLVDRCEITADFKPTVAGNGPDLLGIQFDHETAEHHAQKELVAFEVKTTSNAGAVRGAMWQALSYKVFAHRAYVIMPTPKLSKQVEVLESRCYHHGIGLIYLDLKTDPFALTVRFPSRSEFPHMAMTRLVKAELAKQLPTQYDSLFS